MMGDELEQKQVVQVASVEVALMDGIVLIATPNAMPKGGWEKESKMELEGGGG